MISNVVLPATDAATSAAPPAGETADTGVFDALMALQSLINADAEKGVNTQIASSLEGVELPAGLEVEAGDDVTDESSDETSETSDDAFYVLSALLTALKAPTPEVAEGSSGVPVQKEIPQAAAGAVPAAAPQTGSGTQATADPVNDLVQAFTVPTTDINVDPKATPDAKAGPVIDTTTWNSMNAPAELFAHASRGAHPGRTEAAPMATHVRDPRWADDLGNRLASMIRTGETSASLQLTPVDLGPLEVNLSVRDNQATVHFGAANADTRALLEASMPRLREMLASQGFQLMDSSVSHGFARQTRHESAGTPRVDSIGEAPTTAAQPIHITGLLDLYA